MTGSQDADPAAFIDIDDVAGVVPAVLGGVDHLRGFRIKISRHHIGAFDKKPSAVLDSLHRIEAHLDAGQRPSDRTVMIVLRVIDGHHGRALRHAIAFHDRHAAELGAEDFVCLGPHLFGAADHELQRLEIVGLGLAGVLVDEGVGREQQRRPRLAQQSRNLLDVQRRRILEAAHAGDQRQDNPAGQAQRMEDRHGIEAHPVGAQVDMGFDLAHIGHQVGLGQDHAARAAETARGEQDHADIVGLGLGGEQRRQLRGHDREGLVGDGDFLTDVVEHDDADITAHGVDQLFQLGLLDETPRRDHRCDAGNLGGRLDIGLAGGKIDHDRHATDGVQSPEGDGAAQRCRQHQADAMFLADMTADQPRQGEDGGDEQPIGHGLAFLVLDDDLAGAEFGLRLGERRKQRHACRFWLEFARHALCTPPKSGRPANTGDPDPSASMTPPCPTAAMTGIIAELTQG